MKIRQTDLEDLRSLIEEKKELENEIRECQYSLNTTSNLSDTVVQNNKTSDQTGNIGTRLGDLRLYLENKISQIESKRLAIEIEIGGLRSIDRRIIRLFYFSGYSDERISRVVHFNEDVVGRKRRRAVERITGEEYQNHGSIKR